MHQRGYKRGELLALQTAIQRAIGHAPPDVAVAAMSALAQLVDDYKVIRTGARAATIEDAREVAAAERDLTHLSGESLVAELSRVTTFKRAKVYRLRELARSLNLVETETATQGMHPHTQCQNHHASTKSL